VQHMRASHRWTSDDDGIAFLDDDLVELVEPLEEPPRRRRPILERADEPTRPTGMLAVGERLPPPRTDWDEDAVTRVWIEPYVARLRLGAGDEAKRATAPNDARGGRARVRPSVPSPVARPQRGGGLPAPRLLGSRSSGSSGSSGYSTSWSM
jgi:hypothetical protein